MQTEQRKYIRYIIKNAAFAVFRPEFQILGKIKDISKKGLACEYLNHKDFNNDIKEIEIDILLTNSNFYMPMVPCKIIYDNKSPNNPSYDINKTMECRRCGMKFKKLHDKHKQNLNLFLKYHVI